ncbi:hypothetical protein NXC14_PA00286 (plasmid) [Rhizobium sp. NXC14]|nr:hypothetical protein NXC14_PA00286 [Rhizobium sp. NXC14]
MSANTSYSQDHCRTEISAQHEVDAAIVWDWLSAVHQSQVLTRRTVIEATF